MTRVYISIGLLVASFIAGWTVCGWRYTSIINQSEADRAALTLSIEREQTKKNQAIAELAEKELNTILADERVIIREVVKYASNPNAGRCVLPNEWVQKADDSARMPTD